MNNTNTSSSSSSSSDDESGWTLYLDNSTQFLTSNDNARRENIPCAELHREGFYDYYDDLRKEEEEEEDLSMLSDASSGPPHFEEEEAEDLFCYGGAGGATRKRGGQINSSNVKLGRRRFEAQDFTLDDTASSHPIINMIFSSKENGNAHCVENQASSVKSLIDYSSQGFSATHYQVVVENQSRNRGY